MFKLFNKKNKEDINNNEDNLSLIAIASLLVHSARIDENFSDKERRIIKNSLIEMGADEQNVVNVMIEAEKNEKDSNQILEFTREIKNVKEDKKKLIIEALWKIIYSDNDADMYETNLMRRLSGLLYLDPKIVGDLKEKIKNENK